MPNYPTYKLNEICKITTGKWDANHAVENGWYRFYTCSSKFSMCETASYKGECVIVPGNGDLGLLFYYNGEFDAYQRTYVLSEIKVNAKYLYYHMMHKWRSSTEKLNYGSTIKYVRITNFTSYEIDVPDKEIQRAIVTRIESLFAELDKGVEKLKTAQQQLKVYRQAVLNDLLPMDNSKWKYVPIKNLISTINNGYTPKSDKMHSVGDVQFLKVYNLTFDGTLNLEKDPVFIDRETHEKDLKRSMAYPNDVLINIVGPPLGKVSVIPNTGKEYNINQAMVLFRPNEKVESLFLSYYLQSPQVIAWLTATSKATAGQYNVKVTTCREIPFPMVEVTEQQRIVQEIETRLSACDEVEKNIAESLQQAEALRQSILKKAFEGELV